MGTASWVLVGQPGSMEKTFGTTCHGAGRAMSRTAALKHGAGRRIDKELLARGVVARAQSHKLRTHRPIIGAARDPRSHSTGCVSLADCSL